MSERGNPDPQSEALAFVTAVSSVGSAAVGGSVIFGTLEAPRIMSSWHDSPQVQQQVEVGVGFTELPPKAKVQFVEYGGAAVGTMAILGAMTGVIVYRIGKSIARRRHRNEQAGMPISDATDLAQS